MMECCEHVFHNRHKGKKQQQQQNHIRHSLRNVMRRPRGVRNISIGILLAFVVGLINIRNGIRFLSTTTTTTTNDEYNNDGDEKGIISGEKGGIISVLETSVRSSSKAGISTKGLSSSTVKKKVTVTKSNSQFNQVTRNFVNASKQQQSRNADLLVQPNDYIYFRDLTRYDAAPIVVPEYNLVFFSVPKVACTTFKFLFRRMKGIWNWDDQDDTLILPHNPAANGLTYLWDYPIEKANEIMTSPNWTRAIFVRDPKIRFLSAFLDKSIHNDGWHVIKACCTKALECKRIKPTRADVRKLLEQCHHDHWDSRQSTFHEIWNENLPCCTETKQCKESSNTIEGFLTMIESCHDEHWGKFGSIFEGDSIFITDSGLTHC